MAQATTTREGFDTSSQFGSNNAWSGISNLVYPTEGEASVGLTTSNGQSNQVRLSVPQEAANIPNGARFDEMSVKFTVKKTGTLSSATELTWVYWYDASTSKSTVQTTDEAYEVITADGDSSYWGLTGTPDKEIIENLKDGTLRFTFQCSSNGLVDVTGKAKSATITITYTTVEGKRGAIIVTLV